jgi:DNA-binding CsgD family transcriptional regulator
MPRPFLYLFLFIAVFACFDAVVDYGESDAVAHIMLEVFGAAITLAGVFVLARDRMRIEHEIHVLRTSLGEAERTLAQRDEKAHEAGLQLRHAIQQQFSQWSLTESEREVAYLLIKGLSLEEIAAVRDSKPKTVRQHAANVYAKANVRGRHELAAYFLEDLLVPETMTATAPGRASSVPTAASATAARQATPPAGPVPAPRNSR